MLLKPHYERKIMDKTTIIKTLRDMAKYPTVTLPRDTDALKSAADLLEQAEQAQPVAWFRYETVYEYRNQLARCTKDCIGAFPVYTSPPPRQPEQAQPVAWVDLLKEADEIVRGKVLWKRFIDGTPLANDIAVWMVDFVQQHAAPPPRQPLTVEMRKQMKERCDSMEMRGAFADGWLSAEAAHGIKGEA